MLLLLLLHSMAAARPSSTACSAACLASQLLPIHPMQCTHPSPAAVYAATKAFVDCLSRSLDAEYAPLGVRVQCQAPMFVATKMSKIR